MADSIQGLAESDKAFRYRWEQLCASSASSASKDHDKDSSENDIGDNFVNFEGSDDLWGKTFTASAIVVGHICDGIDEHPDEQECGKDAHKSYR